MSGRRGDRVHGRRAYGGVLVIPCQLNDAYRYWFLADTGTAISLPPDLRVDGVLGVNFLEQFRPTFEFDQATLVLR